MRLRKRALLTASPLLAVLIPIGCGDSKPSASTSTAEATVKGVVKIDGKAVSDGEISFDPTNYQRQVGARTAPIGKDGTYTIKTLVGQNSVKVGGTLIRKSPVLQMIQRPFDVQSGENTFDFEASAK